MRWMPASHKPHATAVVCCSHLFSVKSVFGGSAFFLLLFGMGWGGYGKGGYGWGFPPMMMMPWGKGKGKGLRGFANEKKVWIGGLPAGPTSIENNKKLKEHMAQAGECIFAEINKSGIAGAAYKTPEEVQKAVQMLNGSTFEGHTLEVDVWQKKTPEPTAAA